MNSENDPILVTGAAGFIGSFVCKKLAEAGKRVVGCDNFNSYYSPRLKNDRVQAMLSPMGVSCNHVELSSAEQVNRMFAELAPSRVIHLAAQAGVRYSIDNPAAYIQSNLVAFGNMLEACRSHNIQHLLYASSSSVYGSNFKIPFNEEDNTDSPVSLYAATKKSNELMAYSYSHLYGIPVTGLRFFTVYGPWGRPDMAYFSFTKKMLAGEPIPVFAEGKLLRDFTFIDDIVEGVVRLLDKPTPRKGGMAPATVFNIGNHQPVMVLDFIRTLEDVLGVDAHLDFQPMQMGDVPATFADTEKLRAWIGFAPSTSLEDGLRQFTGWYRQWTRHELHF
jgi:UDP-glucuronate 4-epimerase